MPVVSLNDLAWRLRAPLPQLYEIADNINAHYNVWPRKDKRTNGFRMIRSPSKELKTIQKRIVANLLSEFTTSESAHGGIKKRSTRTNAEMHRGQKCVVNLDARQFYPSVDHHCVYRLFVKYLGFGRDVASLLTRLVTHNGQLVQGSPTSVAIANLLLLAPVDNPVEREAARLGVNYSRYIDDITVSGNDPRPLINFVAKGLSRAGVRMHRQKTKFRPKSKLVISSRNARQEVTGLVVNRSGAPSLSRSRRDAVRCSIHALGQITDDRELTSALASIRGRIAHVRQFNNGNARRLARYLDHFLTARTLACR